TVYCTDTTNTCNPVTSGTAVTVSTESATNYVRWKSTDNAGNVQTVQSSGAIKIDKSAPGTSGSVTGGSAGTNGWYTSDVTYSLSTIDVLSGIASTVYCTDTTNTCNPVTSGTAVTVSTESATNYVRWKSTDNAGNVQTVQSSGAIKIDKTAPTVPTPSDDGDYVSTTTLTFTGAPSDALAGLSSCSAQVDVGDTDGLSLAMGTTSVGTDGDHTFTGENDGTYYYRYSCTDAAGNGSSYSSWSDGVTVSIHSLSLVSNGGTLGGTAAGQKDYGTAITITQTPPSGYTFGGWSSTNDVCTGIGDCSFSMPAFDVTVTATYTGLPFFTSADDQTFTSGQSAAGISTITITDPAGDISASTDIRIAIATSSVDMRFDSSDTSATFGGTASDKVSNPVSYEGDDSVLVISVDVNFLAGDTLTVSGLSFTSFGTANSATTALSMLIHGSGSTTAGYDAKKVTIEGGLTFGAHSEGQVSDQFSTGSITDEPLFAFSLAPHGESIEVESLAFELSSVKGVGENDITNVGLYRDNDSDRTHSGPDAAVGGAPTVSVENGAGAISFGEPFTATTTNDYILTGSVANLSGSDRLYVAMNTGDVTAVGAVSGAVDKSGSAPGVLHALARVGAVGGGGGATALGENFTPVVATTTSGGSDGGSGGAIDPNSGTTIGSEAGYFPPAGNGTPHNGWTAGGNAYASDGSYVTTSGSGVQQSYGTFNFTVPQNDAMTGIGVKLEASGSSASGTIGVKLSWDGGSSWTFEKTTSVLTQLDAVYTVGGQGDTWSRSWSPSETTNGNLLVDVIAHPGNNTISLDAIQVNVYHQATGGGQGGGGAVFGNETRFFANAYEAFTSAFGLRVETFVNWLFGFAHGF
ncbi:MAG TPA: hypothetical protein VFS75_02320, partial [Candidatus Paceibacterota bacterium]|nr:hypothetical protein [Candidatus Paceibacterota bacterium]